MAHIHLRDEDAAAHRRPGHRPPGHGAHRERCPILVQLSTGVGLDVPFEEREKLVELRPRMATLNPCA